MEDFEESLGSGLNVHAQDSEVDLKAVALKEYQRLKRKYFLMQKNRSAVMEKAGSKTPRSQRLVGVLERQRESLELNLSAATSAGNQKKDEATKEKIWKLLQVYEKYLNQSKKLNEEIESMEKTVMKMTAKFYKAKLHIQGVLGEGAPLSRLERKIENSEKKLHIIRSNYDSLMSENTVLKEEIGAKINRRFTIFNRMDQLHRSMTDIRRDLNTDVDMALQVYNIWDDAARKISFIKEKYKEEVRQHLLEMKEYDRLLFHDLREIQFYSTKNKNRQLIEEEHQKEERKNERDEDALKREHRKFARSFKRLEEFEPTQDVDMIISNYRALGQKNFAYFQRISDVNKENERLIDEIGELKAEVDNIHECKEKLIRENEEHLIRLELTRDAEGEKLSYMRSHLQVSDEATQRMLAAVQGFFSAAECSMAPLQELLGDNDNITCDNLRDAFNVLEQHIAEVQLEKELLTIQHETEIHSAPTLFKPQKIYKSSGGPFEPKLVISGRPELGMEKKDDEEDTLFGAAPISKEVQKEHLLSQLRELGVIADPHHMQLVDSDSRISVVSDKKSVASQPRPTVDTTTEEEAGSGTEEEVLIETEEETSGPTSAEPDTSNPISGPETEVEEEEGEEEEQ